MSSRPWSARFNSCFVSCSMNSVRRLVVGGLLLSTGCDARSNTSGSRRDAGIQPHVPLTSSSRLDLLFVVDDSVSMAPLQARMRERLAAFMDVLKEVPGGMPSLHIGVVSSSMGAGIFTDVVGCQLGTIGNLNGAFQHPAKCPGLDQGATFIKSTAGVSNFTGDITDVLGCLLDIGANGCGFEQPFEAARVALKRAADSTDPENGGFLRFDALLGIVMVTNEDDCSVPVDSPLLDPRQRSSSDPLGGPTSYRCSEFGHLCSGVAPPHLAPGSPVTLTGCTSAEDGKLVTVAGVASHLRSLKLDPSQVFVAAIAGPPQPYTVESHVYDMEDLGTLPIMVPSCTRPTDAWKDPEFADPAVRVAELVRMFAPNGVFETICTDDFGPTLARVGNALVGVNP